MNRPGFPMGLFTTNRWVTDESFYTADDAIRLLDLFKMDHTYPCLAANQWITAMVRLFRPQIEVLLHERDRQIARWEKMHPDRDVYEDRELEITSITDIDVDKQIAAVKTALACVSRVPVHGRGHTGIDALPVGLPHRFGLALVWFVAAHDSQGRGALGTRRHNGDA